MNALQNGPAERALLSAMLQSSAAAEEGIRAVLPDAFYSPMHSDVWRAIASLISAGQPADAVLVSQHLVAMKSNAVQSLPDIITANGLVGSLRSYADIVNVAAQRRRAVQIGQRIMQQAEESSDPADFLVLLAGQSVELDALADGSNDDGPVRGLVRMSEFTEQPDDVQSWIVPDLIEKGDVFMLLAPEGQGKSTMSRMMCLTIAAGVHPFKAPLRIEPKRTLLIDLENAAGNVRRDGRAQMGHVLHLTSGEFDSDRAWLWHHPRGLNLRQAADQRLLEKVIAQTRPEFVAFGSMYKAFQQGSDSYEAAAQPVRECMDRLKDKYGFAWWLENHMPKGDGRDRPQVPFGASEWMKWAGWGRILWPIRKNTYEFRNFRGDREFGRDIPLGFHRGGLLRWSAIWGEDEIQYERSLAKQEARK